jgi:hypothetical protein
MAPRPMLDFVFMNQLVKLTFRTLLLEALLERRYILKNIFLVSVERIWHAGGRNAGQLSNEFMNGIRMKTSRHCNVNRLRSKSGIHPSLGCQPSFSSSKRHALIVRADDKKWWEKISPGGNKEDAARRAIQVTADCQESNIFYELIQRITMLHGREGLVQF